MVQEQDRMLLAFLIQERLFAFGRAVDSKRFSDLTETFAADAGGDYGEGRSVSTCKELIAAMEHNLGSGSNCGASQHNILNVQVTVDANGGTASKANFYAVHEGLGRLKGQLWSTWGEYHDSWVLTPDGWRISFRRYVTLFSQGPAEIVTRD
mgnify:CR=1 FL=1